MNAGPVESASNVETTLMQMVQGLVIAAQTSPVPTAAHDGGAAAADGSSTAIRGRASNIPTAAAGAACEAPAPARQAVKQDPGQNKHEHQQEQPDRGAMQHGPDGAGAAAQGAAGGVHDVHDDASWPDRAERLGSSLARLCLTLERINDLDHGMQVRRRRAHRWCPCMHAPCRDMPAS